MRRFTISIVRNTILFSENRIGRFRFQFFKMSVLLYDNVVFHRVIEGFMAQTGDVVFGNVFNEYLPTMVGRGGSQLDDLNAEFTSHPFDRGIVGMARSQNPNSANSQFFIMLENGHFLNGKYTVFGKVSSGMNIIDKIKRGDQANNGMVAQDPDFMKKITIISRD